MSNEEIKRLSREEVLHERAVFIGLSKYVSYILYIMMTEDSTSELYKKFFHCCEIGDGSFEYFGFNGNSLSFFITEEKLQDRFDYPDTYDYINTEILKKEFKRENIKVFKNRDTKTNTVSITLKYTGD